MRFARSDADDAGCCFTDGDELFRNVDADFAARIGHLEDRAIGGGATCGDDFLHRRAVRDLHVVGHRHHLAFDQAAHVAPCVMAVSYTHLTLPTICSV